MKPAFSILLPAYKSEKIISETINSILNQTFADFELVIVDDNSPDKTVEVVRKYQKKDKRIKLFQNKANLGYSGNLEKCRQKAVGKYIYLMGNDDILSPFALEKTYNAFQLDTDVGAVTRPFYCFENKDLNKPVRVFGLPYDKTKDRVIDISESRELFLSVYTSVGQLSGLAMRRDWIEEPVHIDIFPAHAYPFYSVIKKHKVVHLKDWILAVRIFSSQTRSLSSIYDPSPTLTWIKMFNHIFKGKKYKKEKNWGIDFICQDCIGLIQIKNYGTLKQLFTEFWVLLKYRKKNIINPKYWFYVLGVLLIPRSLLIPMVDWFKRDIKSKKLKNIRILTKKKCRQAN